MGVGRWEIGKMKNPNFQLLTPNSLTEGDRK